MYLQFPNAKTIILIRQTVCADKLELMLFVMALGNTTWWKKLKVLESFLEINENIVRIGQCKADVCLLTLYKAKIGVSRSSSLAGWEVAFFPLELALF